MDSNGIGDDVDCLLLSEHLVTFVLMGEPESELVGLKNNEQRCTAPRGLHDVLALMEVTPKA